MKVPFFRPELTDEEIRAVEATLRSGWLTTGPRTREFEETFARAIGARHALALNSCTAALHLAVEALGLEPGQGVLVPTMTFAASAEVVRYCGAIPILVDCDPRTQNIDLEDAAAKLEAVRRGEPPATVPAGTRVVGIVPVHVGGRMIDLDRLRSFCAEHGLWSVEDAAHAFPAAWRRSEDDPWIRCGSGSSAVTCFSFYANKTITTGEGGMAVTESGELAARMQLMALHGLTADAWGRYSGAGEGWDYRIVAPGYKYNLTDIAAALGVEQVKRAEQLRSRRQEIAERYLEAFADLEELQLPPDAERRIHAWHLFSVTLRLDRIEGGREAFLARLRERGVGFSVHWRPLHLHPYYADEWGWREEELPVATRLWPCLVTLPLFPAMRQEEIEHVVGVVREACRELGSAAAAR